LGKHDYFRKKRNLGKQETYVKEEYKKWNMGRRIKWEEKKNEIGRENGRVVTSEISD
jgi:hypothetical protein